MVDKLEACTWCGHGGVMHCSSDGDVEWVRCVHCGREGPLAYSAAEATRSWNAGEVRNAKPAPVKGEQVERIAAAIGKADGAFGYSLNLTRLVDGEETHTLTMPGFGPVNFADREEGYALIAKRRNRMRAEAILATLPTPTEDARDRVKVLEEARPFSEWHEDRGDVLWWKLPLAGAPYCGSPLDLGRGMKVTVQIGFEEHEMPIAHTGGWPFTEEDEPDLWWTPLPSPTFFRTAHANKETDRHG